MASELGLEDAAPHGAYTPIDVCALVAPYRPPLALALANIRVCGNQRQSRWVATLLVPNHNRVLGCVTTGLLPKF